MNTCWHCNKRALAIALFSSIKVNHLLEGKELNNLGLLIAVLCLQKTWLNIKALYRGLNSILIDIRSIKMGRKATLCGVFVQSNNKVLFNLKKLSKNAIAPRKHNRKGY